MNLQSTKPKKQPLCNGSRTSKSQHIVNNKSANNVQPIRQLNNCNISAIDEASNNMNNMFINKSDTNNYQERDNNNIEDDPQLTMMQSNSQDSTTNIHTDDDPPIHSYPSYDDDDSSSCRSSNHNNHSNNNSDNNINNNSDTDGDNNSTSSTKHRRQLRELKASSEDCWDINLSDDEIGDNSNNLPLDWNSSLVRRQFMKQQQVDKGSRDIKEEAQRKERRRPSINMQQQQPRLSRQHTNNSTSSAEESLYSQEGGMSLPEQLLQRRLRRKERLKQQQTCSTSSPASPRNKKPSINHLTGSAGVKSDPLFPDDDHSSTVASSNGASIDYSRSVLHLKSPTTQTELNLNSSSNPREETTTPLHSLPQRPILCSFPDEADRKRIVGCLAAILASSYPYETAPHLLVKKENKARDDKQDAATTEVDFDGEPILQSSVHNKWKDVDDHPLSNNSTHSTEKAMPSHPFIQKHTRQQDLILQQKRQESQQKQQQQNKSPTKMDSFRASFRNTNTNQRSYSSSDLYNKQKSPPPPMTTTSTSKPTFHQSFSFTQFKESNSNIFDKTAPPPSLTTELAEIRHRIRRHAILSELLISSADMLMLDVSHAKAFLPMLEGLLTRVEPVNSSDEDKRGNSNTNVSSPAPNTRQSWKGRGFGGGGMPSPGVPAASWHGTSSPQMSNVKPKEMSPRPPASNMDSAGLDSISEKSAKKSIHDTATLPDIDTCKSDGELYEPFPSTSRSSTTSNNNIETDQSHSASQTSPPSIIYAPLETAICESDLAAPFLQTLTPGSGFRCIALLLLNHLLRDGRGYDARVRHAFKRLAVIVLSHEIKVGGILRVDDEESLDALLFGDGSSQQQQDKGDEEVGFDDDADELARLATRKFEAMEHAIAAKLISMSGNAPKESKKESSNQVTLSRRSEQSSSRSKKSGASSSSAASSPSSSSHGRIALAPKETPLSSQHSISKEQLLRGIKVGSASVLGASLFALTGGLAAPGIAAGLAAVAGSSAIAVGVSTVLSSAAAITTIFGVGGASLAGYKMHRRTKGLTEFNFHKEAVSDKNTEAELFSTVCISGWLRDARDFQRPWGVSPSHPRIVDKQELLERFYFVHNPDNVFRVPEILKHWKGRYFQLWRALREKYGTDPSNLFPLEEGPRINAKLTHEEGEAVDFLLDELGYFPKKKKKEKKTASKSQFFGMKSEEDSNNEPPTRQKSSPPAETKRLQLAQQQLKDSSLKANKWLPEGLSVNTSEIASTLSLFSESETNSVNSTNSTGPSPDANSNPNQDGNNNTTNKSPIAADLAKNPPPKHLLTVWDYHANYGGELYTVQWESELIMELCDSVSDQMIEWGVSATKTILHTTVFATLMTAVTLPYSLVLAANVIDSSWTMAMERADRAGVELAKSLIDSTAGHRPVVLAGKSALVLFRLMNPCVQCEVLKIRVLHLACMYLHLFVLASCMH